MSEVLSDFNYATDESARNQTTRSRDKTESKERHQSLPKLLIVDDEKRIADSLTEIFEMAGFDVVTAYDGCEAAEIATRFQPDYLLSDVLMPRMNGVELAIAIRKMFPTVRILLFSGQAGISEILLDGRRQGFEFELISKPIHPLKLVERFKDQ